MSKKLALLFVLAGSQLIFSSAQAAACAPAFTVAENSSTYTYTLATNVGGADFSCDNNGSYGVYADTNCDTGSIATSQGGTALMDGGSPDTIQYKPKAGFSGTDIATFYTTTNGTSCSAETATVTVTPIGPLVTSVSPTSGPIAGTTSVVITGTGFASVTAVNFGATVATSYSVINATSITAVAPAGSVGTVDITVTANGGTSPTGAGDHFTYVGLPTITGVSPGGGPTASGTSVIITGTNFTGATIVRFGTRNAVSFTVNSATQITATAPTGAVGVVDVTVQTAGGTSATGVADRYTYTPLATVTSVSPNSGSSPGGSIVRIIGTNFFYATAVKFGATNATIFTVNSATVITATSPPGTGTVDVTVVTAGGTSATGSSDLYTYVATPTVTGVSLGSGPATGGTSVTITGTNFTGASAVKFGAGTASSFTVNSATQITATSSAGSGTVDITVVTAAGTSATGASDQFSYIGAPTVTAVSPGSGPATGGTSVTITGTNFTGASAVKFGAGTASSFTVNSATQITATSSAGSGTVDITVVTAGGTSATGASDQFSYIGAPTVTAVSPGSGLATGGTSVTITGTNFTGASAVKFGTGTATSFTVVNASQLVATAPSGTGTVDVTIVTSGGTSATGSSDHYTYVTVPTITAVSPNSGPVAGGTNVTIAGTNFTGATALNFGTVSASNITVLSSTQITATSPAGTGTVDITLVTSGGTSATGSSDQFTYASTPTVTGISPHSGPATGGTSVTITGTNFTGAYAVKFGASNASSFTVDSSTQITATSSAGSGTVDITVVTTGGTSATGLSDQFLYAGAPTVSSMSPTSGLLAGGTSVILTGTNFSGASAVKFGTGTATSFVVNSATQITATSPAGSAGTVDVTVVTPGGTSATGAGDQFAYIPTGVLSFTTPTSASVTVSASLTNAATSTLSGGSYGTITYSSSNTAVATVNSSGVITPVSAGTSTITATQAAVPGVNAQATQTYGLTVNALPVGILSFTTPTSASVTLTGSLTNAATSTLTGGSYGAITYSSSNTAVATVNNSGVITAISVGTSTITATQAAVAGINSVATKVYALTVSTVPVGTISFTVPTAASVSLGASLTNAATSTLTGGSFGVISYSSANVAVATVSSSGVVTPVSAGTSTITATQAAVAGANGVATNTYSLAVNKKIQATFALSSSVNTMIKSTGTAVLTASGGSGTGALSYVLTNGSCTLTGTTLKASTVAGACVVTATKAADANYAIATATVSVAVQNVVTSSVTLTSSNFQPQQGQSVTLSATITPASATGTVSFVDGSVVLGSVAVHGGVASFTTKIMTVAAHSLTARYSGDAGTAASISSAVNLNVSSRPNPLLNPGVKGIVSAHVEAAQRFTMAQMSNIYSHVQLLHNDFNVGNNFNLGMNAAHLDTLSTVANEMLNNYSAGNQVFSQGDYDPARPRAHGPNANDSDTHGFAVAGDDVDDNAANSSRNINAPHLAGMPLGFWTAGNIDYGSVNQQDGTSYSFTSSGVTAGVDMLVNPNLIAGASIGYARGTATIDAFGSDSKSKQWSTALYATYQPIPSWFVDVVAGVGHLNYDNQRWSPDAAVLLSGNRDGRVSYESLSLAKDMIVDRIHWQPFGRLDAMDAQLNSYSEQGSDMALTYQDSNFKTTTFTGGLTVFEDMAIPVGVVTPSFKFQMSHMAGGSINQGVYYADLGSASTIYNAVVLGMPENTRSIGLGLNLKTRTGLQANCGWLGSLGGSSYHANSVKIDVRIGF